jgi:hypothetical protein
VQIVVEVRLPAPSGRTTGALWWWIVAFGLIALAAHAQPTKWRSYPFGSGVNSTGTDRQGREWTARSPLLGTQAFGGQWWSNAPNLFAGQGRRWAKKAGPQGCYGPVKLGLVARAE